MLKRGIILLLFIWSFQSVLLAQDPFQLSLTPLSIDSVAGLQSYAFGQSNGKWLVFGGRLDGLHRRQPFASFDVAGNNNKIWVIDPIEKKQKSVLMTSLATSIQEQLSSTNMQFYQEGEYLYIVGGYGYNASTASKKTFNYLTAIHVSNVISAILNGTSITPYFRQISDDLFAVTGGHLKKVNKTFYLIGGNKFDGDYNPMGNPTYTQQYTNSIRRFFIADNGVNLSVNHLPLISDAVHLHRRDYNAVSQIMPDKSEGVTMFSGVFQPTINLPYLNSVDVDSFGYKVNNTFQQYYNHYHCAVLPLYSNSKNQMHTVFFGGISQYYDSSGVLVQDNNVPFVKTIARVSRESNGNMTEYKLPIEMPGLLGASAEFIPNLEMPFYENHILKLDDLTNDSALVGYIYGGINSTAANIFFTNNGTQSSASNKIYAVYIKKNSAVALDELNKQSNRTLNMQLLPNPSDGTFLIQFNLKQLGDVKLIVRDELGKVIEEKVLTHLVLGNNVYSSLIHQQRTNMFYYITIESSFESVTQKLLFKR